eukprot:404256-Hanusia_phi.AAC.2
MGGKNGETGEGKAGQDEGAGGQQGVQITSSSFRCLLVVRLHTFSGHVPCFIWPAVTSESPCTSMA